MAVFQNEASPLFDEWKNGIVKLCKRRRMNSTHWILALVLFCFCASLDLMGQYFLLHSIGSKHFESVKYPWVHEMVDHCQPNEKLSSSNLQTFISYSMEMRLKMQSTAAISRLIEDVVAQILHCLNNFKINQWNSHSLFSLKPELKMKAGNKKNVESIQLILFIHTRCALCGFRKCYTICLIL